jgi:hypothetical protein
MARGILLGMGALVAGALATPAAHAQTVRRVPQDYPTIQAAIVAASDGDSVLVAPGTYPARIDFLSKTITVESAGGRDATIIDGGLAGTVVRIVAGAGQTPVLRGFTVRNGYAFPDAGGVYTYGGPALIEENLITSNHGCFGSGLEANFSSATIRANVISDNHQNCSGGYGGGIVVLGAGTTKVLGNVIDGNSNGSGGGIALFAAGAPTLSGNVIRNNSGGSEGGGISMGNSSNALIVNNMIVGNSASAGGGITWQGGPGPVVVNNTIASNGASRGSAVFANGSDVTSRLVNNILVGSGSAAVLDCDGTFGSTVPVIAFNDVFHSASGAAYGGICTDQTGLNGNISAAPLFVDVATGNFHLNPDSPAVDAGTNTEAPPTDIDGDPRPLDGNGDGTAVADMGADEVLLLPLGFFTLTPCRVADTRNPDGPSGGPPLAANGTRSFPASGLCGIPPDAKSIAINVTVLGETDVGDLRIYPAGQPTPSSSVINFAVGKVRANNATIPLGAGGQIAVQCDMPPASTGHTHFLFDVSGYFR